MSETESVSAAALEDAAAEYHPAASTVALFRAVEIADSLVAEARAEERAKYATLVEAITKSYAYLEENAVPGRSRYVMDLLSSLSE